MRIRALVVILGAAWLLAGTAPAGAGSLGLVVHALPEDSPAPILVQGCPVRVLVEGKREKTLRLKTDAKGRLFLDDSLAGRKLVLEADPACRSETVQAEDGLDVYLICHW